MNTTLLFFHSIFRWLILIGLLTALLRAAYGHFNRLPFGRRDDGLRHWTATLTHIQLMLGIFLYTKSAAVKQFFASEQIPSSLGEPLFFATIHISMMVAAIGCITLGSALAKRQIKTGAPFKTMLIWYGIGLALILIAIPWPFSPLAQRPFIRTF